MAMVKQTPPRWIVVRLGADQNWWLDETSDQPQPAMPARGVLNPEQVAHLIEALDEYRAHGYRSEQFESAFQAFALQSELSDGRLRLAATNENIFDTAAQLFALPVINEDGTGAYSDLLEAIGAARIRKLNATHHYARNATELEMFEELDALDADRYFSDEDIHVFDEISEILEWSPAEWDEP
jgi:hypothetical protein